MVPQDSTNLVFISRQLIVDGTLAAVLQLNVAVCSTVLQARNRTNDDEQGKNAEQNVHKQMQPRSQRIISGALVKRNRHRTGLIAYSMTRLYHCCASINITTSAKIRPITHVSIWLMLITKYVSSIRNSTLRRYPSRYVPHGRQFD